MQNQHVRLPDCAMGTLGKFGLIDTALSFFLDLKSGLSNCSIDQHILLHCTVVQLIYHCHSALYLLQSCSSACIRALALVLPC